MINDNFFSTNEWFWVDIGLFCHMETPNTAIQDKKMVKVKNIIKFGGFL